jgi:hypothetical protein
MRFIQNSLKIIGSTKLTVISLIIVFILVVGGTFYQVDNGLLAAQKKFFGSWGLLLFNFIPFPGMKTVALLLTVNLIVTGLKSFSFTLRKSGLFLMHFGTIVLFIGTAIASLYMKESVLTIFEGEKATFSRNFNIWELIAVKKISDMSSQNNFVSDTINFHELKKDKKVTFAKTSLILTCDRLYQNCDGLYKTAGIVDSLQPKPISGDQAGNFPGIIANIRNSNGPQSNGTKLVLYGGNSDPVGFEIGNDTLYFMLKPHEHQLPFQIGLNKFVKVNHPGTSDAKSYESHVTVLGDGLNRDAVISMNRPFRHKSLTLYQNGFMRQNNVNVTTLFVVDNSFRLVPYVSGIIIILGLLINFIGKFAGSVIRQKESSINRS